MQTLPYIFLKVDVKKATPKPDQMAMMMGRGMRGGRGGPRGKLFFVPSFSKTHYFTLVLMKIQDMVTMAVTIKAAMVTMVMGTTTMAVADMAATATTIILDTAEIMVNTLIKRNLQTVM